MRIGGLQAPELILILVIVIVLFGVGRLSKIGSELGQGIRAFKDGIKGDETKEEATESQETTETAE